MEKVKLTQEQANAIKRWINKEQLIIAKASGLLEHSIDESIAELTMEQLVKALYIGYEVEPEFKVGDWVVRTSDEGLYFEKNKIFRAGHDIDDKGVQEEDSDIYHVPSNLRHATPEEIAEEKERRWWKKHGRDVWELRKGDVMRRRKGRMIDYVAKTQDEKVWFDYRANPDTLEYVQENFCVVCFVEQRLDREGDE